MKSGKKAEDQMLALVFTVVLAATAALVWTGLQELLHLPQVTQVSEPQDPFQHR